MKNPVLFLLATACIFSCSKKDSLEKEAAAGNYFVRVAAVDNNLQKTYTAISKVKSGKVSIEFETADVVNVKEFDVEVSGDGSHFQTAKVIAVDDAHPNKVYTGVIVIE